MNLYAAVLAGLFELFPQSLNVGGHYRDVSVGVVIVVGGGWLVVPGLCSSGELVSLFKPLL